MNNNYVDDYFIKLNNARILSGYEIKPRHVPEKPTQEKSCKPTVTDSHKRLLMAIYNSPRRMTLTEACKSADLSAGTGSRIAEECEKRNLIKIIHVPFGRGKPKYPVLLPDTYEILGVQQRTSNGRGAGYEHTLYQDLFSEHFSDFRPIIELNRNGKFIDVAIETNECLICIEIAMTSVHERENIEKDFDLARAHAVIIACLNDKVQNEVREIVSQVPEHIRNNTEVLLLSELLRTNSQEIINKHQLTFNM